MSLYKKPTFWLHPQEYQKVYSEINNIFETQYKDKVICAHASFGIDGQVYIYWFENYGFNDYNIFLRVKDDH